MLQQKIINREISWLSFNHRVLQEAADKTVPIIERFRFLGIFSNNRDEFFKVRVATIKRTLEFEKGAKEILGADPVKLLNRIQRITKEQQTEFNKIFSELIKELNEHNIYLINENQVNKKEHKDFIEKFFEEKVLFELSPIMLNNVESFPSLKDKSIYLAIMLSKKGSKRKEVALIEVPVGVLPRFIELPPVNEKKYLIILDDIIRYNLPKIFVNFNYDTFEAYTIKITRDAELDIDNDISKSLLEKIQKGVSARKKGQPVRFVYDKDLPKSFLKYLLDKMDLDENDNINEGERYHNFKDFMAFPNLGDKSLEYNPTPPLKNPLIKDSYDIFSILDNKDILLHVPYQNFYNLIRLLRQASIDPDVKSIEITLYRVAKNSKVVNALINALRNGKSVTVIFELQARFDEETNIYWSKRLEEEGARVIFGAPGLKVHAKLILITKRFEDGRESSYTAIGTGNFHEGNARVYADYFLMTSNNIITAEVRKIFSFFDNYYRIIHYRHLLVSPFYMRRRLLSLIEQEIRNYEDGKNAYILIKANNLVDEEIIDKLYQASCAGVKITLIVRGICSLIPGIKGLSDNIEIISIVDKFLEHSRVFIFCNNNEELMYISSADIMKRNLDYRLEVAVPILDPDIKNEIKKIIEMQLLDNTKARIINKTQSNQYKQRINNEPEYNSQLATYNYYKKML